MMALRRLRLRLKFAIPSEKNILTFLFYVSIIGFMITYYINDDGRINFKDGSSYVSLLNKHDAEPREVVNQYIVKKEQEEEWLQNLK